MINIMRNHMMCEDVDLHILRHTSCGKKYRLFDENKMGFYISDDKGVAQFITPCKEKYFIMKNFNMGKVS